LDDAGLARSAGVSPDTVSKIKGGEVDAEALRKLAQALELGPEALVASARGDWYPAAHSLPGLAAFQTPFMDMVVNAYLVWDPASKEAAVFDTGTDASELLRFVKESQLTVKKIFLTHTHSDHVGDLRKIKDETQAPILVSQKETTPGAETFSEGTTFQVGNLKIETRSTTGHSVGGTTYVIHGLAKPVAVVGDALFAGSMGGGMVSYRQALETNRNQIFSLPDETILCPGHGPLTTVGEEKQHNPFFPEFQR
jgi:glyoxylase-like metal-dependent hydrolase (beta-lactamase superfamily II)